MSADSKPNDWRIATKQLAAGIAILVLLALDWAALHDILKANEPDLALEYWMVFASIPALTLLLVAFRRDRPDPR